jgi:hypothetical protein
MAKELHVCKQLKIFTSNDESVLRERCELPYFVKKRIEKCSACSNYMSVPIKKLPDLIEKYGYKTVR